MQITRHDTVFVVITGGFADKLKDQSAASVFKKGRLSNVQYITGKSTYLHQERPLSIVALRYDRQGIGDRLWVSKTGT